METSAPLEGAKGAKSRPTETPDGAERKGVARYRKTENFNQIKREQNARYRERIRSERHNASERADGQPAQNGD